MKSIITLYLNKIKKSTSKKCLKGWCWFDGISKMPAGTINLFKQCIQSVQYVYWIEGHG